jgi:2-polyprenyl-6-methoxyphenol hydroxylase-like FAD-dependent oxidoreductase
MRVVVAGAGIGGLAAAIGLRAGGHEVVVLERADRIDPIGAGITLFANAMSALERLGVARAVAARGSGARSSAILTSSGDVLASLPSDLLSGLVALHRADLQAVLESAAGEVRLGSAVTSVEQDPSTVVAHCADGGAVAGDLIVGADGLNSTVRRSVAAGEPKYAGYTAWRGVAEIATEPGRLTESWGRGERFGLVDIGGARTYWFATKNAPEGERDAPGGRKVELVERYSPWHPPIAGMLEATEETAILRNDVYYVEPLPRWRNGRVVLLGDAAHAVTPGAGQGAAQAIEDAVVLVSQLANQRDVPTALEAFEATRRPRVETVLRVSRRADRVAQMASPLGCRLRNAALRLLPATAQRRDLGPLIQHRV